MVHKYIILTSHWSFQEEEAGSKTNSGDFSYTKPGSDEDEEHKSGAVKKSSMLDDHPWWEKAKENQGETAATDDKEGEDEEDAEEEKETGNAEVKEEEAEESEWESEYEEAEEVILSSYWSIHP